MHGSSRGGSPAPPTQEDEAEDPRAHDECHHGTSGWHGGSNHGVAHEYPVVECQYQLLEEIGQGASATVRASVHNNDDDDDHDEKQGRGGSTANRGCTSRGKATTHEDEGKTRDVDTKVERNERERCDGEEAKDGEREADRKWTWTTNAQAYRARCLPYDEIVAVKLVDLESGTVNLDEIQREAKTMKNVNHPNLLPLHCCFVAGVKLWMVMPYVAAGSLLHIMKWSYPEGLDEVFIATVLREVLKGLEYLHKNGMIHRDIKAGNILIDANGQVKLADFGVSATIERTGTWGGDGSRFTFVGTPCWMAPEVMDAEVGYDFHADIWSFGITILELAHGHAPFARYPPMKVLMMTLQNPPPTLQEAENKTFSKALRELVALCLQKDPMKRPTAAKLLEHRFFKGAAKGPDYLVKYLLADLPSLSERVKAMRNKDHPGFKKQAQKEAEPPKTKVEEGWNFDVADSKGSGSNPASETAEAVTPKDPQRTEGKDTNKAAVHMEATAESPSGSARRKTVGSESAGGLRTGRTFKVLEADDEDDEISSAGRVFQRQPSLQKTMSQPVMAALDRSSGMSTSSTAALVPALQHMLVHAVQQEKLVKQLLASLDVHDTAKVISQTKSVPHLEDLDHPNPTMAAIAEVQNQVAQLMSDMQVLRERNQHLARKVNMLSSERDVGQKGKEEEER